MFLRRNYPIDRIKSNYVLHNSHCKYSYDHRRTGGSTVRAGVLIIGFWYKESMKYERLVYNESCISPRRTGKQSPEPEV